MMVSMGKGVASRAPNSNRKPGPGQRVKTPEVERRLGGSATFSLLELSPLLVVDGVEVMGGLITTDVVSAGALREKCPYCRHIPLSLVLRHESVLRNHLFCEVCTRCFDFISSDGRSALTVSVAPIY